MNGSSRSRRAARVARCLLAALAGWCLAAAEGGGTRDANPAAVPGAAASPPPTPDLAIRGWVRGPAGPVAGATVRVPGTAQSATSGPDGGFVLRLTRIARFLRLTASAPGFFIGETTGVRPRESGVTIMLEPHPREDNPDYIWVNARAGQANPLSCQRCMSSGQALGTLPFDEWARDAHSQSAVNPRFLSMYNGTDLQGRRSPTTRYRLAARNQLAPLEPDPSQPYYGPGLKLDTPGVAGNCATCHVPAAAVNLPYEANPNAASGAALEGVTCDLCHKIVDVVLNRATGRPNRDLPGVLSYDFLRPPPGRQVFAGPYDDVPGHSIHSPLQNRSEFCAPCHSGVFWNVQVYDSFGEWLASPFSREPMLVTCQDCHMPPTGATRAARPAPGSGRIAADRAPSTVRSHFMAGAGDPDLLRRAVALRAMARRSGGRLEVNVVLTNDRTGHHVPTDSPLRHLILLVSAESGDGQPLALVEGPTLPEWCGTDDAAEGAYAGRPGKAYAKILQELETGVSPSGAYWNPTRIESDNRLAAGASDRTRYAFAARTDQEVTVRVRLLFRRAFRALMLQKGWNVPDIEMAERVLRVAPGAGTLQPQAGPG